MKGLRRNGVVGVVGVGMSESSPVYEGIKTTQHYQPVLRRLSESSPVYEGVVRLIENRGQRLFNRADACKR